MGSFKEDIIAMLQLLPKDRLHIIRVRAGRYQFYWAACFVAYAPLLPSGR
jgi:hypothetical protein